MLMSGDQIPAPKAQLWGLVEYVVDTLDEGVEQFGGGLASLSPNAMRELRQLLRETRGPAELRAGARGVHALPRLTTTGAKASPRSSRSASRAGRH